MKREKNNLGLPFCMVKLKFLERQKTRARVIWLFWFLSLNLLSFYNLRQKIVNHIRKLGGHNLLKLYFLDFFDATGRSHNNVVPLSPTLATKAIICYIIFLLSFKQLHCYSSYILVLRVRYFCVFTLPIIGWSHWRRPRILLRSTLWLF